MANLEFIEELENTKQAWTHFKDRVIQQIKDDAKTINSLNKEIDGRKKANEHLKLEINQLKAEKETKERTTPSDSLTPQASGSQTSGARTSNDNLQTRAGGEQASRAYKLDGNIPCYSGLKSENAVKWCRWARKRQEYRKSINYAYSLLIYEVKR